MNPYENEGAYSGASRPRVRSTRKAEILARAKRVARGINHELIKTALVLEERENPLLKRKDFCCVPRFNSKTRRKLRRAGLQ